MKIAILGTQLTSLVNFRGPLVRELVQQGHEVLCIAPEPVEPWLGRLRQLGAEYVEAPLSRTGLNPLADLSFLRWLERTFSERRPDVLLAFHAKPVIYGSLAARRVGVARRAALIEGQGQGFGTGPGVKRAVVRFVLPKLYRWGLRAAQLVFFLNEDDELEFRRRGLVRGDQRVVRLPGIGVDLDHFAERPWPSGPPTFTMIARLLVDKGVREFAEAARLVKARYPEARFRLLGPLDPSPAGVRAEEVRSWTHVDYLGETDDVREELAQCHVFVLPTFYGEGLPRSILEAMATGRPIVTTAAPGARDTVIQGKNGFLVPMRDAAALATTLESLIQRSAELPALGRASRRLAEERYRVEAVNQRIIAALLPQRS